MGGGEANKTRTKRLTTIVNIYRTESPSGYSVCFRCEWSSVYVDIFSYRSPACFLLKTTKVSTENAGLPVFVKSCQTEKEKLMVGKSRSVPNMAGVERTKRGLPSLLKARISV